MNRVRAATNWENGDIPSRKGTGNRNARDIQGHALPSTFLMNGRR